MSNSNPQAGRRGRHKYAYLFFLLVVLGIVNPAIPDTPLDRPILSVLVTAVLISAVYAVSMIHRAFKVVIVLAVLAFALDWLSHIAPVLQPIAQVGRGLFFILVTGLAFTDVLTGKTCGYTERLYGAAAVYLMAASAFAQLYGFIDWLEPGAFTASPLTSDSAYYFSLVTQTTLGYGDISPVLPIARSLAVMQSTLGILYIAILVARLAGAQPKDG